MKRRLWMIVCGIAVTLSVRAAWADQDVTSQTATHPAGGLSGATIFIVRHGEKPGTGPYLNAAGATRAEIYATYFEHLKVDGRPIRIDSLVASKDNNKSDRPRLTLEPLSNATGIPIQQPCGSTNIKCLVKWLKDQPSQETVLIAWQHSKIDRILTALGVAHDQVLPDGNWPPDFFDWVIAMRFDKEGHLVPGGAHLLHEPMSVDNVVWDEMDHPPIIPMRPAEPKSSHSP